MTENLLTENLGVLMQVLQPSLGDGAGDDARAILERGADHGYSLEQMLEIAQTRAGGAPLAYALGWQTFLGVDLRAAPGALVPREETELLGRAALEVLAAMLAEMPAHRVVDMCCGAGNLACALAVHLPDARVWASDLTDGCVRLASANVDHLGLEQRVTICQGDLFEPLADLVELETIDVVVCNPPYISSKRLAEDRADLLDHEPREAFDGGPYGLSIHQRVIRDSTAFLRPGGWLMLEFGLGQERQLERLFQRVEAFDEPVFLNDPAGAPRVVVARKKV